jgi:hypothetical protein
MNAISPAVVDIVDVFANAVKIPVWAIMPSDKVFDILGRTYDVLDVRGGRIRKDGTYWVSIIRADNPGTWELIGEAHDKGAQWRGRSDDLYHPTITVIPSIGARAEESEQS